MPNQSVGHHYVIFLLFCIFGASVSQIASGQTLEEDTQYLKALGKKYQLAWEKASQEPDEFVAIARNYAADVSQMKSVVQKYKSDIDSKTDKGKEVQSAAKNATIGFSSFTDSAQDFAKSFQERFKEHIQRAKADAERAIKEKTPGYYKSALHELSTAEWMLTILVAFNGEQDATARMLGDELIQLTKKFQEGQAKLTEETKKVVQPPKEIYVGKDLAELRAGLQKAWKKMYPKDVLLDIVFDHAEWKMNRVSRWNTATKTWEHIDRSFLELTVIVQKDSKTALLHAAFVNRDNRTNQISFGIDTKGSSFVTDSIDRKLLGK